MCLHISPVGCCILLTLKVRQNKGLRCAIACIVSDIIRNRVRLNILLGLSLIIFLIVSLIVSLIIRTISHVTVPGAECGVLFLLHKIISLSKQYYYVVILQKLSFYVGVFTQAENIHLFVSCVYRTKPPTDYDVSSGIWVLGILNKF